MPIPTFPKWFNSRGLKMALGGDSIVTFSGRKSVLISDNVGRLQIHPTLDRKAYQIFWQIRLSLVHVSKDFVSGKIHMNQAALKDAFAISGNAIEESFFVSEFEADTGIPGLYIRKGQFLNLPMPGTGMDNDPNISIFVSDEIKKAVRELIDSQQ